MLFGVAFPQHWMYSAFMLLALVAFVLICRSRLVRPSIDRLRHPKSRWIPIAAFVGGMFGAKLPFLLFPSELSSAHSPGWLADGKTVVTGIMGAYAAVELLKAVLGIKDRTGDSFAIPLAVAMSIGRLGCFFNGCCAGNVTTVFWAMDFGDQQPRHPIQLYESVFHLFMVVVLFMNRGNARLRHQQLKFYLLCYCLFRFLTEFIRPAPRLFGDLTFYQYAVLILAAGLLFHWRIHSKPDSLQSEV